MYKINSLVFKWICFCLLVPFCLSCTDKAPEYPDLEGYWKQEWIEDEATDGQSECNRLFWAFQLGVSEIRDLGGNGYGTYVCRYDYNEGAATLRMYNFRVKGNQSQEADVDKLKHFGIPSGDVTFEVVRLDGTLGRDFLVFSFLLIFSSFICSISKEIHKFAVRKRREDRLQNAHAAK